MAELQQLYDGEGLVAVGGIAPIGLPENYRDELVGAIRKTAYQKWLPIGRSAHENNRDHNYELEELATIVSAGVDLCKEVPWLFEWYLTSLVELVKKHLGIDPIPLEDHNEAINGLVFGPGMRIETHTDVWAVNPNLFLKSRSRTSSSTGGTYIGKRDAQSHDEILKDPLGVVRAGEGQISILACTKHPHTVGRPSDGRTFEMPDLADERFWVDPGTRISLNFSYTTASQLESQPDLATKDRSVGYSQNVL